MPIVLANLRGFLPRLQACGGLILVIGVFDLPCIIKGLIVVEVGTVSSHNLVPRVGTVGMQWEYLPLFWVVSVNVSVDMCTPPSSF